MVKDKEEIIIMLKKLKDEIKKKYKVKSIGLFGSYVNNKQKETSDIDFLIEFEDDADLFHYTGLSFFLEDHFNKKVDVISRPALKRELREQILREVIYV